MINKLQKLLKKMQIDKSICILLKEANETRTDSIKFKDVCDIQFKQIDLYEQELSEILNEETVKRSEVCEHDWNEGYDFVGTFDRCSKCGVIK